MILAKTIRDLVDAAPGAVAVYARNLRSGDIVDVNADVVMATESAAKTFLLIAYSSLVRDGTIDPGRSVIVPEGFQLNGTGVLRYLRPGVALTLEDLAWLMIMCRTMSRPCCSSSRSEALT